MQMRVLECVEALLHHGPNIGGFQLAAVGFHPLREVSAVAVFGDEVKGVPDCSPFNQTDKIGVPGLRHTIHFRQKSAPQDFCRARPDRQDLDRNGPAGRFRLGEENRA